MPNSIRWRLPVTYGAIAFLTIISLGGALLLMLSNYYSNQERRYLEQNAFAVSQMVGDLLSGSGHGNSLQQNLVQSQIESLAYLTQTRIRLFDLDGLPQADSGSPEMLRIASTLLLQIDLEVAGQSLSQSIGRATGEEKYTAALVIEDEGRRIESQTTVTGSQVDPVAGFDGLVMNVVGLQSPGSLGLAGGPGIRSKEVAQQAVRDLNGRSLGQVELSE